MRRCISYHVEMLSITNKEIVVSHVVIIGAGLSGLSAAYHLEKRGFYDYILLEKDHNAGGLCRSVMQDGFTFDYTGHLLHCNDAYFRNLLSSLVGFDQLNNIIRRSYVYSQNTYTKYPYQINLWGLPPSTIIECIDQYVQRPRIKNIKTFYQWVLHNFGAGIAKHFFFPFQQKIFAYDLQKISASWTGRFVPQTSLPQMLQGALLDTTDDVGYNAQFFYPKQGGIQYWVDKIADQLKNPILFNHQVKTIDTVNNSIECTNGTILSYKTIINTMPLDSLLSTIKARSCYNFNAAKNKLLCNSVINFNIGIKRENISDKHWIYFPEDTFPFYRLGFNHNFASSMTPPGCSALYGEFSYLKDSSRINTLLTQSLAATKKLFGLEASEIITEKIISISHAYVIYDLWRERYLKKLLQRIKELNIYSIGRYGEWKYSSMQEAVLDGKKIADTLTVVPATQVFEQIPISSQPKSKEL